MNNIVLTKESSTEELKCYFHAVLRLSQADNKFPINLDEVWPLVYSEKGKAVRALKNDFIEDVDYQSFAQNGKREIGGTVTHVYNLSLSCMEFFIARKVRPVFEVYRQVFHGVANGALTKSVKTEPVNGYSIEDKVEFISICKDSGFFPWELAAQVGDLLDGIGTMGELRTALTLIAEKEVLEKGVLQIIVSLYARHKGLPYTKSPSEEGLQGLPVSIQPKETQPAMTEPTPFVVPKAVNPEPKPAFHKSRKPLAEIIPVEEAEIVESEPYTGKPLRSMKKLLVEKGYRNLYAYEVMEALYQHGCVKRVSFKGSTRWEWTLTTHGLTFGRNTANREGFPVRPKWMADKFDRMMRALGYWKGNGKEVSHD